MGSEDDGNVAPDRSVKRSISCFCTFFITLIFGIMVGMLLSTAAKLDTLDQELQALDGARAATCKFSGQPGAPNAWTTEDSTKVGSKQVKSEWTSIECEVTVDYVESEGTQGSVPGAVYAGEDLTNQADVDALCEATLAGNWPNIVIQATWNQVAHRWSGSGSEQDFDGVADGWACGKRHKVHMLLNGEPDVAWKDEEYKCPYDLPNDGADSVCTVDQNGQVRLGTADQQKEQTLSSIENAESARTTFIILVCIFGLCFAGCCGNLARLFVEYQNDKKKANEVQPQ
jgi:hypothetical protein